MKKLPILLIVVSVAVTTTTAQTSPPQIGDVVILKKQWRFQAYNPSMHQNPNAAAAKAVHEQQMLKNRAQGQKGIQGEVFGGPPPPPITPPLSTYTGYIYEIKVKNVGERRINGMTLEYVFTDPETQQVVGRRQLTSARTLRAGEVKTLIFRSKVPPTGTVDARRPDKEPRFKEEVMVTRVS
jgi:hypothetical protein